MSNLSVFRAFAVATPNVSREWKPHEELLVITIFCPLMLQELLLHLWKWRDACLIICAVPILPVKMPDFNVCQGSRVNTPKCNCNPIWVWAWVIEWGYATDFTECVFCSVSGKGVSCKKLLRISQKLKIVSRYNEVSIGSHVAGWAVAVPCHNTWRSNHFPPYTLTMTTSGMHHFFSIHFRVVNNQWS